MLYSVRPKTPWKAAAAVVATAAVTLLAACGGGSDDSSDADEIVIGFATSESGNMAPFDVEPTQAAMLRIDQINEEGGVDGKTIRTVTRDVRSSPETVGTAATELIGEGVDLLVTPCDFDLSAPGASVAQSAEVPAISICAGDPKMADLTTLGDFIFSANAGSDVEGGSGAAWAIDQGWQSAYILQDESIEYTKSAGAYFQATFEELGGEVVGSDAFPGGDSVNIASQAARLRGMSPQPDFVYVASWNPGGATAIRQLREAGIEIPILGPAALDGQALLDIVGNASDIYYTGFACYSYCTGADSSELDDFVSAYDEEYGAEPSSAYAVLGYSMVSAIADALAGIDDLDGPTVRDALAEGEAVSTPVGEVTYFSETCHKIIDFPMSVINVSDGAMSFVTQQRLETLPDLGDGNACAG
ncbi:branched-chain amino acid ABC transporter substrate-binding protein [Aeromicrobium sp. PE09-221]|uniref:ABC transporter substrate-binding protein n=1 Tax=Aeromicrobium sp. PE09-221 TaxID=1898043 RepID=UPI000B3EDF34|nr:ABC transporter substrate-binding protein [Aeromicrobium sp. PE09-221]OUZ11986.1 branched-chain amino acid ABC transporter substrate-binding protein [Aeromicrobium sp. PE09-221]